jgi:hypothetical protein
MHGVFWETLKNSVSGFDSAWSTFHRTSGEAREAAAKVKGSFHAGLKHEDGGCLREPYDGL